MVAQIVRHPLAMKETRVQSLGQEDSLEKEMATHSSILGGEFHRQRSLRRGVGGGGGGATVNGVAKNQP